jgi:N utilization substance protein A
VVPDDQLNLAIGRKGQNVKLAAKLLGWKIDIFTESRFGELNASRKELEQLASVAEMPVENFLSAGFTSLEQLVEADDEALSAIEGMTATRLGNVRLALKLLAPAKAPDAEVEDAGPDDASAEASQAAETGSVADAATDDGSAPLPGEGDTRES